ncbi:MAG: glycoside hydrolase family 25 protein [Lachnospiraceae bacterium]|nr:glycoside hydrolase family 25 protein [Lachnospiraceae bacterium]
MKKKTLPIIITTAFLLAGCSAITVEDISSTETDTSVAAETYLELPTSSADTSEAMVASVEVVDSSVSSSDISSDEPEEVPAEPELPDTITFVDVYKESYTVDFKKDWALHNYNLDCFIHDGDKVYYQCDEAYTSRLGIDVSHHQKGKIDWKKVADSGVEFVIVRVGYRGYGLNSGWIKEDEYAASNIKKAQEAGLDVGTYFFSQAINEEEALEEAEFVIDFFKRNNINPEDMELPVVFDPESIRKDDARTDNVTGEQFTKNTRVFCDKIKEAGFKPMVYSNMLWEAYMLDLNELSDIPVWYADYEELPQTPYDFVMWQYSEKIHVPGIPGNMDGNILLVPNN